jgi:VWFA-related protein
MAGHYPGGKLQMKRLLVLAALLSVLSIFVSAQNTRRPSPTPTPPSFRNDVDAGDAKPSAVKSKSINKGDEEVIKVDTDLVTTPVSVLDREGRFIAGLKKRDFKLLENDVPQTITYFQSEEQPFTVVLMIDTSPSTRYKIDDIHWAAVSFLNQLRPQDKVMVVSFDQRVRLWTPEPTSDRKELYTAIYKTNFGSGTSLYEAVACVAALEQMKATGRKAMVMFTDGVDTTSRMASFQSTIEQAEEIDALIYPIRYDTRDKAASSGSGSAPTAIDLSKLMRDTGGVAIPQSVLVQAGRGQSSNEYEKGQKYLQTLADNSGGRMFEADTTTNLDTAFAGIAEELRRQYSIGYYPESPGEPGDRKSIRIQVLAHPGVVVRAKRNYVVKRARGNEPSMN